MNVLVTGANGFIGRHVVRELAARGDTAHTLGRESPDEPGWPAHIEAAQPDVAIHLAWYAEPGGWMHDTHHNLASLQATVRLLDLLTRAGCARIVLAGSGVEDRPDATAYAACKRAAHEVAMALPARTACAHIYGVFGPGEDPRRVVPLAVNALLGAEAIDLTDGRLERDYVYVEDVASALVAVAKSDLTGAVDVATGTSTSLRTLLLAHAEHTGADPDLLRFGARPYSATELTHYAGDPSALRSIGWTASFDLDAAAKETVAWWRSQPRPSPPRP